MRPAYDAALARLARLGADDRRDRHRAVLRDRAAALRRAVGRRAHDHGALAAWRRTRTPSIRSRARSSCAGLRPTAIDAFAAFYKLEELRWIASAHLPPGRCTGAADGADGLIDQAGVGRPDPAQQPARHLHQFRQSARSLRPGAAGGDDAQTGLPFGITLLAPGGADAMLAEIGRVFHADTQLPLGALKEPQPALAATAESAAARRSRRSPSSARISPACRSTANCASSAAGCWRRRRPRRTTGCMRSAAATRPKPGLLRVDAGQGRGDRDRDLGAAGRSVRPFRRRGAAAAVHRHDRAARRPQRQGLPGRSRRHRRRARYLGLRRLARVSRAGESAGYNPLKSSPDIMLVFVAHGVDDGVAWRAAARGSGRRARSPPPRDRARHAISPAARECGTGRGGTAARARASPASYRRDSGCVRRHRCRCESASLTS